MRQQYINKDFFLGFLKEGKKMRYLFFELVVDVYLDCELCVAERLLEMLCFIYFSGQGWGIGGRRREGLMLSLRFWREGILRGWRYDEIIYLIRISLALRFIYFVIYFVVDFVNTSSKDQRSHTFLLRDYASCNRQIGRRTGYLYLFYVTFLLPIYLLTFITPC